MIRFPGVVSLIFLGLLCHLFPEPIVTNVMSTIEMTRKTLNFFIQMIRPVSYLLSINKETLRVCCEASYLTRH